MSGRPELEASGVATTDEASAAEGRRTRFYYGWFVVGASVLVFAGFIGTLLCFGVFLKPLEAQFGWTRGAISGAMSVCIAVQGVVGIIMGRFTDKYNMGFVVAIGTVVGAASYFFLSRLDTLWEFYLGFGVGAGICSGCAFTPVIATVSKWFDERRRTLALGITMTGVVIGQMVLSPVMNHVIQRGDWRVGYTVSAIVVVACGAVGTIIMSRRPPSLTGQAGIGGSRPQQAVDHQDSGGTLPSGGPSPSDGPGDLPGYTVREAARTAPFWMIIITAFAISFGFYIFMSQIVAHARDVALDPGTAALILTLGGVGSLAGSLLAHWLTKKMGSQRTLFIVLLFLALAMFLFTATNSAWSFFVVALVFGFTYGTAAPVRMGLIPPLFGLRSIGAMLGCTTTAWSVGGLVGPAFAGYMHDVSGRYVWAFVASGIIFVLGALSVRFWGSHKKEQQE